MRSQLLISVEHLPTIREDIEVTAQPEKLTVEVPTDNGLEEYVKSIQTLALPSSLTDHNNYGQCKAQRRSRFRPRPPLKLCEPKILAVTQDSHHTDPLAWLYRQSEHTNQEGAEAPRSSQPQRIKTANSFNLYKTVDASKRLQGSKGQNCVYQSNQERRGRHLRLQQKCCSSGYGNWGSLTKFHKPHLPVIYEL